MDESQDFVVVVAQRALEQVPQGCTGVQHRWKLGLRPNSSLVEWHSAFNLAVSVAEDTYSSEEIVDHQPVHLRVMDTADLVTLPPLELRVSAAS